MNALRFSATGPLENLQLAKVAKPVLAVGEALVRVRAAGINGSDAANVRGWLPMTTVPRIPGRDFAGDVVEVSDSDKDSQSWVGSQVWGTGGERGFSVDGTFAEFVKLPISSLSRKPRSLDYRQAASLTLPWICAHIAVHELAQVKAGENVVIIGARGGIGSGVVQLCTDLGANPIGTYRSLDKITTPKGLKPVDLSAGSITSAIEALGLKNKVDVLIDCAGYEDPMNDALQTLTPKGTGRVVVMAVHRKDGKFALDLRTFYTRSLTLKGLKSSMLSPQATAKVLDGLSAKFDAGTFQATEVEEVSLNDVEAVRKALDASLTRSASKRSVIIV